MCMIMMERDGERELCTFIYRDPADDDIFFLICKIYLAFRKEKNLKKKGILPNYLMIFFNQRFQFEYCL